MFIIHYAEFVNGWCALSALNSHIRNLDLALLWVNYLLLIREMYKNKMNYVMP